MKTFSKILVVVLGLTFALGLVGPIPMQAAALPSLGAAESFSVLAQTAITDAGAASSITGDVGMNASGASITDLTSAQVTPGLIYSNPVVAPAEALLPGSVQANASTAYYTTIPTLPIEGTPIAVAELSGITRGPGVYDLPGDPITLSGVLTLDGPGTYIFRTTGGFTSSGSVNLINGARACDVFWNVGSLASIAAGGPGTSFAGTILAGTGVHFTPGVTLNGRALAIGGDVTMSSTTISGPTCAVAPPTAGGSTQVGTINVVKTVINDNGGTKTVADFPLFVSGRQVASGENNAFTMSPTHAVTETADPNYTQTFSGDCDATGHINLGPGDIKFCIVTNNDIGPAVVAPPVPPLIEVVKVPNPLALPAGPGAVAYTYTLRNIGTVPVTDVTRVGDTCSPITLASGDTNTDAILQVSETWTYTCSTTLSETHTNTVVATGWANGVSATDIASATVVVGLPTVPPLIHVTKIPSPLTLAVGGGMVTYTERITNPGTVALSDVILTDDKCSPMNYISGDTNSDSKLDVTETWVYTCRMNLSNTTTNTAIAVGQANGFSVRDFAVAVVTVATAVPALPQTGFASEGNNVLLDIVMLTGILMLASILFVAVLRKRKI
jgi:uncharacterized repeat protein (TIGR01451 family)